MAKYEHLMAVAGLFFFLTVSPVTTFAQKLPADENSQKQPLSLQEALQRIKESPALKAAEKFVDIQDGLAKQAGLLPNPDISLEVGNFAGENDLEGFDGSEATVAVSQLIELGGKRNARKLVANHEKSLAERDFKIRSQDLQMETMKAFYSLLASQERLNQAKRLLGLAEQGYQIVVARVEAGKVSPVQELRASVELNIARNSWETSQRKLVQARHNLSSLWGAPKPDFDVAIGDFGSLHEPPTWDELQEAFPDSPELKRWETELARTHANVDLERAKTISDVTFSFGIRNFQETNDNAFVAGLEFPLPLFDRNQGGHQAARSAASQSKYQRDAAVAKLTSDLQSAYQELLATFNQAQNIKQNIMPAAEKANAAARIGYQDGKFDYLETLDAQRTLFEVNDQYIDAFNNYHMARLDVMRMVGRIDKLSIF